nr:hypothetical protein [Tanacetum cinerariifolium]
MSDSEDSTITYTTALPPPNYVLGPEEPEQAPPSPVYIPYVLELVYPEYIPPKDDVFPAEEQPLPAAASPTAESPRYIPESDLDEDPEEDDDEDPEEDPADYLADHDDEEEEEEPSGDDADKEDEEQDKDNDDEKEEHPSLADSIPPPPSLRVTAMISFRPQSPTLSFTKEDAERFLAMPNPPPSPLTLLSSPLPQIPSPPLLASPSILPIPLPAALPPLQLLSSDSRADRPEVTLPPRKRLSIVHCPGYEAGESLVAAAARTIEGRRADYGFVDSVEAEIRQQREEDIGYGIRYTWIDPRDVAEEEALTTLEGVNTMVTKLVAVQEQDTQDIYGVMKDTQGRQTEIFQRVEALGHLATALSEIRALQAREQARVSAPEGASSNGGWTGNPYVCRCLLSSHCRYFGAYAETWDGGFLCWFSTTPQMVFSSPWLTAKKELTHREDRILMFHDPAVFGVPADLFCWSPYSYWFWLLLLLVAASLAREQARAGAPEGASSSATSNPNQAPSTTTTTVTNSQLQAMIDQGVNVALAARDANRTGDDSH